MSVIVVPIAETGREYSLRSTRDKRRHLIGATPDSVCFDFEIEVTILV